MATSNLEIKIKALIEGIDDLVKLKTSLDTTSDAAKNIGKSASGLDELSGAAEKVAAGFNDLAKSVGSIGTLEEEVAASSSSAATSLNGAAKAAQTAGSAFGNVSEESNKAKEGIDKLGNGAEQQQSKWQALKTLLEKVGSSFTALTGGSTTLNQSLGSTAETLKELGNKATSTTPVVSELSSVLKPLLSTLAALAGIKITFDYLKDAANYAGKVQTLGVTLEVVGNNAGYTTEELKGYEEQLKQTGISTEAARNAMIQMMNAGISLGVQLGKTKPQVVELARAAQDLAVVTGENSSETLQRLVINIQQMDTMGLRFMGLMVDMTAAQQKFAEKLGVSAGALTEAQKRQAVLNEVMAQASKLSGAYELSMETVGKKVASMTRYTQELSLAIGNLLLPMYGALVDGATDLVKSLIEITKRFDESGTKGQAFGRGVKEAIDPLVPLISKLYEWVGKLALAFGPAFEAAGIAIGTVIQVVGDLLSIVGDGLGVVDAFGVAINLLGGFLYAVADGVLVLKAGISALVLLIATATSAILSPLITAAQWLGIPDTIVGKMQNAQKSLDDIADKSAKSIEQVSDHFANGESYIGKWTESLKEADTQLKKVDATPAEALKSSIISLTRAQNDNTLSSQQVAAEYEKLRAQLDQAKNSSMITEREFARLSVSLEQVAQKMRDELDAAFKTLKTSSNELATGISQDSSSIVGALRTIAQNGLATADQFARAFATSFSMAKNVEELAAFSSALDAAKTRWPEALRPLIEEQAQLSRHFDEIYDKQLKALSTSAEWDRLRQAILKLGMDGTLSMDQVAVALAKGEQAVRRLDPAFVAVAQSSDKVKVAVDDLDKQIELLNQAISVTAAQAEKSYTRMAEGYRSIAESVKASTDQQIAAIDDRYKREILLIDTNVTNATTAEDRKLRALLNAEASKSAAVSQGYQKQLEYIQKQEEAERSALAAKLAALDEEAAKVEAALGKQKTARAEYERRMKDLDLERKNAVQDTEDRITGLKITAMQSVRDRYRAHISTLIAEEERLAGRIKELEREKEMARMSTEERIRAIQKSAMSDYQAYLATMRDVDELSRKAIEAAARGDFDAFREYINQAKAAASELNTVVKEGETVYVSKQQAANNAIRALTSVAEIEQKVLSAESDALKRQKMSIDENLSSATRSLQEVEKQISSLQDTANRKTELNIEVNDQAARQKIDELNRLTKDRDWAVEVRADLAQAQQALDKMKQDIEAGREVKVDADVTKAMESLTRLGEYAEKTHNTKLAMDVTDALTSISVATKAVEDLGNRTAKPKVAAEVSGDDKLSGMRQQLDYLNSLKQVSTSAKFEPQNDKDLTNYVYKVTTLDGKVIFTDARLLTDQMKQGVKEVEAYHYELGQLKSVSKHEIETNDKQAAQEVEQTHEELSREQTTSEHDIETNADQVQTEVEQTHQELAKEKTESTHDVKTNAGEVKQEIDEVTQEKTVTDTVNVNTDADQKKPVIDDALEQKDVTSSHNINSNATELQPVLEEVLTQKDVTSSHTINTNAEELKEPIETALEQKDATSTHNINTNATEVVEDINSALEQKDVTSNHTINTNAQQAKGDVEALNGLVTQSSHTVSTNAGDALGEILSLNGRNTYSTHTVYVVKEYLFGFGGMPLTPLNPPKTANDVPRVFAKGGPVTPPNIPQYKYPRMTGGTVPGAGNDDTVARMLDVGAFVLRKSAVQRHGMGRLLSLLEKAKTLPKVEPAKVNGTTPALLMPGEIVVDKDTVSRIGSGFLGVLNGDIELPQKDVPQLPLKFADGGIVGRVPDYLSATIDLGKIGVAFEKGGAVSAQAPNVIQVDLRGNSNRASVTVTEDQSSNLIELLTELKARAM